MADNYPWVANIPESIADDAVVYVDNINNPKRITGYRKEYDWFNADGSPQLNPKEISDLCKGSQVKIDIIEIRKPELDAQLVAEQIAVQLERRISFRRAMKRALQTAMEFGAEGIRLRCAGRLGGADIARAEGYREGKVPLQTLRVPLDYGFAEARTLYGIIGVKCWVNKKEEDASARPQGDRGDRGERGPRGPRGGGGGDRRPSNRN